ncbi:MAG: hypothetical protein ACE5IW_12180 [bacterium]
MKRFWFIAPYGIMASVIFIIACGKDQSKRESRKFDLVEVAQSDRLWNWKVVEKG